MLKDGLIGQRLAGEPLLEVGHFIGCPICGQDIDKRDLAAVFHHAEPGHTRLPDHEAGRVVNASAQLSKALRERS